MPGSDVSLATAEGLAFFFPSNPVQSRSQENGVLTLGTAVGYGIERDWTDCIHASSRLWLRLESMLLFFSVARGCLYAKDRHLE